MIKNGRQVINLTPVFFWATLLIWRGGISSTAAGGSPGHVLFFFCRAVKYIVPFLRFLIRFVCTPALFFLAAALAHADTSPTTSAQTDNAAIAAPHAEGIRQGTVANNAAAAAEPDQRAAPARELLWELDAYYSILSLQIPLTTAPQPDGGQLSEREVYQQLFLDSLKPRVLLLEASVYPLPAAGTWFKKNHARSYDDFDIGEVGSNQLNIIDGVTAGFQEPWALSAFTGSSMAFSKPGSTDGNQNSNRGYMGYLLSVGAKHIHNNVLIDDHWWELEWKLKGERDFAEEELSWSFRLGVKNHGNADIRDVAYIGLRRSNLNYQAPLLSLLNNSNLELLSEVDRSSFRFLRQEITVGRHIPFATRHFALTLDLGLIYEDDSKYSGALTDPNADALTLVFRPNIRF